MTVTGVEYRYHPESFFIARGAVGPSPQDARSWMAWHFTHRDNLNSIANRGALAAASSVTPTTDVADPAIKERRRSMRVRTRDNNYPESVVADHVPWYWAALSPMLYRVKKNANRFNGSPDDLVFLGLNLGDAIDAGLVWCCSDRNAAAEIAQFSQDHATLGDFVDFELLTQKMWNNTAEDPDRASRRAAELLVLGEVPLDMIHIALVANAQVASDVRSRLDGYPAAATVRVVPSLFT